MRAAIFLVLLACHQAAQTVPPAQPPGHPPSPEHRGRVVVSDTTVELLEPIRFEGQSATITLTSLPMVDAIAATLIGNPNIRLVEVRAFGGDGVPEFQEVIGDLRARAVVDALIRRGVEPKRLRPAGLAKSPNGSDLRQVFEIIERD